jgi:phage recombination protein Bet
MNQVVPLRQNSVTDYTAQQLALIKRTVAADCNDAEFSLFIEVARRFGLDPFRKQIHAVVYSKDNPDKRKLSLITAIDGYRSIAARNKNYRPDENTPVYEVDEALKSPANPAGIVKAVVYCFQYGPDGQWRRIAGEAYWAEFAPIKEVADEYDWIETGEFWPDTGKPKKKKVPKAGAEVRGAVDGKWASMPHVMLSKCAEAQALRKGWPEDLSGVYVEEEMDRARVQDVTASEAVEQFEMEQRLRLTKSNDAIFTVWAPNAALEAVPIGQFADRAAAFVRGCVEFSDLQGWQETNRVALQAFWARAKSDALALKKIIEARETELLGGPKK